jgi:signal transduction histidine kinase
MPGTRVYLDLSTENGYATLLFRNISKEELNIPATDLLERFVRGDRSRHTEGSGLGLSIAQSLTELMGGELALEIDGDLFKVTLKFPLYEQK